MIDQAIVILYMLITLVVGLYVGRNTKTLEDFAVGARNFSTIVLVSTVFASVADAGMTTGLASSTYSVGPIFLLSFLGLVFSNFTTTIFIAPKMKKFLGLITSGELFEKMYGKGAKILMGCSTLIESVLTTAIQIFAIAHVGEYFFGLHPVFASFVVSLCIIIYTFRGGIRSVTATDVFQFGIMVIAIPIMCGIGLIKIGGFDALAGFLKEHPFYVPGNESSNPWEYLAVFVVFCMPTLYPLCIQRMLMAKNTQQISSTFLITGILSLPFYVAVGLIGIVGYILIPGVDPNVVFPALINEILPIGIRGLVLAGIIAIFMSTVDSVLNIGSLALIHDIVGGLAKNKLKPATELKLLRFTSVMMCLSAMVICHMFASIMDIVFFLILIGSSMFFPGLLWGILGFKPSRTGFWIGIVGAGLTLIICSFGFNLFPMFTLLIAHVVNSSVILIDYYLERPVQSFSLSSSRYQSTYREIIKNVRRGVFLSDAIRNQDYCTVFFVCAIVVSMFPFFFPAILGLKTFDFTILTISTVIASISLCMLFRELWWHYVDKAFPVIWIVAVTLALPAQSFYMFCRSDFSLVWLVDAIIIFPLMFLLMSRSALILSTALGLVLAVFCWKLSDASLTTEIATSFGYWALVVHITILAICLALFRKRDQETFVVTSSTLAHEASRSFLAFENAACYLNNYLPEIISSYRTTHQHGVSETALDELLALPTQLENAAKRSRLIVEKLSFFSISTKAHFDVFNILVSINNAIIDPSLKTKLAKIISVSGKSELFIKGDIDQITQVFINLLENAHHATMKKSDAIITITVNQDSVHVKDTGDGIDKNDIVNIFDENFSTKSTRGQGLAFCKRVMKNHGGTISCTSIKGEFTEFRLSFPPH